eukprot:2674941-Prymnesium_polylepis.1
MRALSRAQCRTPYLRRAGARAAIGRAPPPAAGPCADAERRARSRRRARPAAFSGITQPKPRSLCFVRTPQRGFLHSNTTENSPTHTGHGTEHPLQSPHAKCQTHRTHIA